MLKDGVAREYLYVYEISDMSSSGPGLKTFLPGRMHGLEVTDTAFSPRFEIKTNKAGGAETISRYTPKQSVSTRNPFGIRKSKKRTRLPRVRQSYSWDISYKVECPYCGKKFKRKTMDTKLNKHKDKFGNRCYGKIGFIV